MFLIAVAIEFREHVAREDRREIAADVALLSAAIGTMLFLTLRPESTPDPASAASAAEFALIIASGVSAFGALALARPNVAHLGMFVAICAICAGVLAFANLWLDAAFEVGRPQVDLPIAFAVLFLAALVSVIPRKVTEQRKDPARYGRAVLTTLSVAATSAALALVAVDKRNATIEDGSGVAPDRRARRGGRAPHPGEPGPRDAIAAGGPRRARSEGGRAPRDRQGAVTAPARERDPARVRGTPPHGLRVRGRRHRRARPAGRGRPRERRLLQDGRAPAVARRGPALDRARGLDPGRRALRRRSPRPGRARSSARGTRSTSSRGPRRSPATRPGGCCWSAT